MKLQTVPEKRKDTDHRSVYPNQYGFGSGSSNDAPSHTGSKEERGDHQDDNNEYRLRPWEEKEDQIVKIMTENQ